MFVRVCILFSKQKNGFLCMCISMEYYFFLVKKFNNKKENRQMVKAWLRMITVIEGSRKNHDWLTECLTKYMLVIFISILQWHNSIQICRRVHGSFRLFFKNLLILYASFSPFPVITILFFMMRALCSFCMRAISKKTAHAIQFFGITSRLNYYYALDQTREKLLKGHNELVRTVVVV